MTLVFDFTHRNGDEAPHGLRQVLEAEGRVGVGGVPREGEEGPLVVLALPRARPGPPAAPAPCRGRRLSRDGGRRGRGAGHARVRAHALLHRPEAPDGAPAAAAALHRRASLPAGAPHGGSGAPAPAAAAVIYAHGRHAGAAERACHDAA